MSHATENSLNTLEKKATAAIASIFGLRMFGLFLVLPVLATFADSYSGYGPVAIGLAIGIYGFSQALFQIPLGLLSDRIGRKPIIVGGLILFSIGSLIAAQAHSMTGLIIGRAVQGSGAIASALMALAADVSREQVRSKIMAGLGLSIGIAFVLALAAGPILADAWGLSGLFYLTAVLALLAIAVVIFVAPSVRATHHRRDVLPAWAQVRTVLADGQLLRLDLGIFSLHLLLSSSFVVVPLLLLHTGIAREHHAWIYLPVMLVAFVVMLPGIIIAEKRRQHVWVARMAILTLLAAQVLWFSMASKVAVIAAMVLFFIGFNLMEALLPSLVSRFAPVAGKGTAMGVYSTSQFIGSFVGGAASGLLVKHFGDASVFLLGISVLVLWMLFSRGQQNPPTVGSTSYSKDEPLSEKIIYELRAVSGIHDVVYVADDRRMYVRFDSSILKESQVLHWCEEHFENNAKVDLALNQAQA